MGLEMIKFRIRPFRPSPWGRLPIDLLGEIPPSDGFIEIPSTTTTLAGSIWICRVPAEPTRPSFLFGENLVSCCCCCCCCCFGTAESGFQMELTGLVVSGNIFLDRQLDYSRRTESLGSGSARWSALHCHWMSHREATPIGSNRTDPTRLTVLEFLWLSLLTMKAKSMEAIAGFKAPRRGRSSKSCSCWAAWLIARLDGAVRALGRPQLIANLFRRSVRCSCGVACHWPLVKIYVAAFQCTRNDPKWRELNKSAAEGTFLFVPFSLLFGQCTGNGEQQQEHTRCHKLNAMMNVPGMCAFLFVFPLPPPGPPRYDYEWLR